MEILVIIEKSKFRFVTQLISRNYSALPQSSAVGTIFARQRLKTFHPRSIRVSSVANDDESLPEICF
jgi:hypothetical protein